MVVLSVTAALITSFSTKAVNAPSTKAANASMVACYAPFFFLDVVTLYESEIYEYCIVVRPDIGINEMDNKIISVNF